jgi:hypothetical protein
MNTREKKPKKKINSVYAFKVVAGVKSPFFETEPTSPTSVSTTHIFNK